MDAEGLDRESSTSGRGGIAMVVGVVVAAIAMAMLTVSLAGAETDGSSAALTPVITIRGENFQAADKVVDKGVKFTGTCDNVDVGSVSATFAERDLTKLNKFLGAVGEKKKQIDKSTPLMARTNPQLACNEWKILGVTDTLKPVDCNTGSCAFLSSEAKKAIKVAQKKKNAKKAAKKLRTCKVKGEKWTCVKLKLTADVYGPPDGTASLPHAASTATSEIGIKPIRIEMK